MSEPPEDTWYYFSRFYEPGQHALTSLYDFDIEYYTYIDGKEVWRSSAGGVSQVPEYLKLTNEIGKWAGDIKQAKLPDYFEVDYVRVYERVDRGN